MSNDEVEWLTTVIGGGVGGLISGGILLIAEYLRHHWKKKERYQELLIEKRFSACAELMRMLTEFDRDLYPIAYTMRPLRAPDPNLPKEEKERAKRVNHHIDKLIDFVEMNEMILGDKVVQEWNRYSSALLSLRLKVQASEESDTVLRNTYYRLNLIDGMAKAVQKQLSVADIKFVPAQKWQKARKDGQKMINDIIAEAKAER